MGPNKAENAQGACALLPLFTGDRKEWAVSDCCLGVPALKVEHWRGHIHAALRSSPQEPMPHLTSCTVA